MGWQFWKVFQKAADKIQAMELPPAINDFLQELSDKLPTGLANGFINYLKRLQGKEGKEVVVAFVEKLMKILKGILSKLGI